MSSTSSSAWTQWLAVVTLGVGSFAIVTAELAPIGLLTNIGDDLDRSASTVGLIVTLYAWIAAGAALLSVTLLSHLPRRPLLIGLMLVLALSGLVSAMSTNFTSLMGARIVGSFAHGAFWAMIGTLGAQIVPKRHVGIATSIIFGGVSAASVIGVPLVNYIGHAESWRAAFYGISALSLAVAIAISLTVPQVPGKQGIGLQTLKRIVADRRFRRIFTATVFAITAHFMAFTYIEPFLRTGIGITPGLIAPLLFAFGVAGLGANVLTGALIDRYLKSVLVTSLLLAAAALLVLAVPGVALGVFATAALLVAWGGGFAAILVSFQTWILKEAGPDALPASAIYVALFNSAIGLGAMLGSLVLSLSGLAQIFLLAGITTACSFLAIAMLREPESASVSTA